MNRVDYRGQRAVVTARVPAEIRQRVTLRISELGFTSLNDYLAWVVAVDTGMSNLVTQPGDQDAEEETLLMTG